MQALTDKVFKIEQTKGSYAYVIKCGDGAALIDTGISSKKRTDAILNELQSANLALKRILITHSDYDHIGNAALLQERTGCQVYISDMDLGVATGRKSPAGLKGVLSIFMRVRPAKFTTLSGGGIAGIKPIPTPGHTPGHTSYLYGDVLFVGDSLLVKDGRVIPPAKMMTSDMDMAMLSVAKMSDEKFKWVCPAHGGPLQISTLL